MPAPLAAIVCPTYLPGAEGPPVALAPAAALATLAPQLPDLATERAADVFHRVAALVERVPAFTVRVDDLDVAELALRRLLDDVPASAIDLSDGVPR